MGITATIKTLILDIFRVYFTLLKVMVPALIIVKALALVGGTALLAKLISPLMAMVGLPDSMGIVWAAAILTNIYTSVALFCDLAAGESLSVAQVSVLGCLILVAHSLPVEGAIAKLSGIPWRITIPLRILGALALGALVNQVYLLGDWQQQVATLIWQPSPQVTTLSGWAIDQLLLLMSILLVISTLMTALRVMRWLGVEKLMAWLLTPLLKSLTISKEASQITIVGLTLGLSFGAGLLIDEVRSGKIAKRDIFIAMCFLGLVHSLIEDTLLILMLGADINAVLWGHLIFAIVVMAIWARFIPVHPHDSTLASASDTD